MIVDFELKPKAILRELNLIPKSILAGLGLGFGSAFLRDIVLGFALSQVFWFLLRSFLTQVILLDLCNFNPKYVKLTLGLLSPLIIPCLASLLLQQTLSAFVLSSLTGFVGGKILHHSARFLAQTMMEAESFALHLGGYVMKGLALALT